MQYTKIQWITAVESSNGGLQMQYTKIQWITAVESGNANCGLQINTIHKDTVDHCCWKRQW